MLLLIIFLVILAIGIFCLCIENRHLYSETLFAIGLMLTILGAVATIISCCCIGAVCVKKNIDYEETLYEKQVLEYRIENQENNLVGGELLYKDIVEFNNNLRKTKKWSKNLFTNWFYNEKIAEIDYIEYDIELKE